MRSRLLPFAALSLLLVASAPNVTSAVEPSPAAEPIEFGPNDWPWWRGPRHDGVAADGQTPPLRWSDSQNVAWKTPIPGRGHGSATLLGDRIFLCTAESDRQVQSVVCLERATGRLQWQSTVHQGGFEEKGNSKTTLASCTPACDGRRIYVNFLNGRAVHTSALDLDGKLLWQTKVTDFVIHQGFGSSPALYGPLVIVTADNKGAGAVVALERSTGKLVWKVERPNVPNYTSPIILKAAGREQLFLTGCDLVTSLDPLTGKKNWEIAGATTECVTSTITDGQRIFTSGGYPKNHLSAVMADGSGKVAWENNSRVYVPSMLVRDGHLFSVLDAGVVICWQSDSGKELWKGRLGGTFSSSPVLVGDRIYATNEAGRTYVFRASTDTFDLLAENQLGTEVFATPVFCGSRIYARVARHAGDSRQEFVYCLAGGE